MEKEIAVAVIHGMGSQEPDFADALIEKMEQEIRRREKDPEKIAWRPIYWADILHPRQKSYFERASAGGDLDYRKPREFVLHAFGDASAYQNVGSASNTTYFQIHARIHQALQEIFVEKLGRRNVPLLVMAHSLGGHIFSNYVWDTQHGRGFAGAEASPFEKFETLSGIVTFGCNIPLFTFAYEEVLPIRFPPPELPPPWRSKAKWINLYDPDDALGYPLKPISPTYAEVVNEDRAINAGGIFTSWNPVSHSGYWEDKDFVRPSAELACEFL